MCLLRPNYLKESVTLCVTYQVALIHHVKRHTELVINHMVVVLRYLKLCIMLFATHMYKWIFLWQLLKAVKDHYNTINEEELKCRKYKRFLTYEDL